MSSNEIEVGSLQRRAYAEIDLDNAGYNYRLIRGKINKNSKLCCVVKANAYGHGAVILGRLYEKLGADMLAVSNIAEALQLRQGGIKLPVLILGYTTPECAGTLAKEDISQCAYSLEYARELSNEAVKAGVSVKIHIKFDTGMGRIGFACTGEGEDSVSGAAEACRLPGLDVEGAFTHFAVSDEGNDGERYTKMQYERFVSATGELEKQGINIKIKHCSNSAAILDYPEYNMDMVRAGIILYGLQPSGKVHEKLDLRPVMSLRSVISHVKTVRPGDRISYGGEYVADSVRKVATVPIGYADGFFRSNYHGSGKILVRDTLCPIVGRICMDQLMIDVSQLPPLHIGETVTVFGEKYVTADDVARVNGTINYEICCFVGERVPRIYIQGGEIVSVVDYVLNIR